MKPNTGKIIGVSGNMVTVAVEGKIMQNEVAYIMKGDERLKAEIVRIGDGMEYMQVSVWYPNRPEAGKWCCDKGYRFILARLWR